MSFLSEDKARSGCTQCENLLLPYTIQLKGCIPHTASGTRVTAGNCHQGHHLWLSLQGNILVQDQNQRVSKEDTQPTLMISPALLWHSSGTDGPGAPVWGKSENENQEGPRYNFRKGYKATDNGGTFPSVGHPGFTVVGHIKWRNIICTGCQL